MNTQCHWSRKMLVIRGCLNVANLSVGMLMISFSERIHNEKSEQKQKKNESRGLCE